MKIFINFNFLTMKKMKFIVIVFGVTLAVFGSINANAMIAQVRCSGSSGGCAKVQTSDGSSHWMVGHKS